jgi:hypothetical protein
MVLQGFACSGHFASYLPKQDFLLPATCKTMAIRLFLPKDILSEIGSHHFVTEPFSYEKNDPTRFGHLAACH